MDSRLLKTIITFFNGVVNRASMTGEERTRFQHYSIFLILGVPTMLLFGAVNLAKANYQLSFLIFISNTGLLVGWLLARSSRHVHMVYRLNAVLFSLLVLFMVVVGGEGGSKILWMYTFPLIAFFLFGKKEGAIWSGGNFTIAVALLWAADVGFETYVYAGAFKARFIITYLIVTAVTFWFEYFRDHYRTGMELKTLVLQEEKEKLEFEIGERKRLERELKKLANTDPLTGALNRRRFNEIARSEFERHRRYRRPMAILMMDIDHFKSINDTYGHPVGDSVLETLVKVCRDSLRSSDLVGRLGGEEFAILLVETGSINAVVVAERLRKALASIRLQQDGAAVAFTVSIGVATNDGQKESVDALMQSADRALYAAKNSGRNRVEIETRQGRAVA